MERWTIRRLRSAMFAEERRKLLALHVLLGLALSPIPTLLTGWAYLLDLAQIAMLPSALYIKPLVWFWLTIYSVLPCPAFLAWSLPSMHRVGLPKRSIGFLCLLVVYNPVRINLYRAIAEREAREHVYTLHYKYIILWDFKNVDTAVLIALVIWAFCRHRDMQPIERASFHWFLFVCALWAACDFFEVFAGSFFLAEFAIRIFGFH
ncbi:MAG: hypothetical protein V3T80_01140 [Kiloniellales bacterium]